MQNKKEEFDEKLAQSCAKAYSVTCGIGCTVSDTRGRVLYEVGYGCASCRLCQAAYRRPEDCIQAHIYGMTEAERFGGKYIYFCPMGLSCFVSPILGSEHTEAKITVGPFLMVDRQDYVTCDLVEQQKLPQPLLDRVCQELENIPYFSPEQVEAMSTLLFMAVGFMNNVSAANRMLDNQDSTAIQGQVTSYIQQLKVGKEFPPYPFDTERALLRAVRQGNKMEAQRLLNELYSYILFISGTALEQSKTRIYDLLVLISRTAIEAGANPDETLRANHNYLQELNRIQDFDALCVWLTRVTTTLMDSVFDFTSSRHANIIHQSIQYLGTHYHEHITLEEMARQVFLSPPYFSRVFKQEVGESFNIYLNRLRIDRSKELLLQQNLRLGDIAQLVGFEDQSYFTKVFKKLVGVAPIRYRETHGHAAKE